MERADVFLDTSCLVALLRRRDSLHRDAAAVMAQLVQEKCPLITSDWVLAEFLGGTASPPLRAAAISLTDHLLGLSRVRVVAATRAGWAAAFALYKSRRDKAWSLVDCTTMLLCREHGITRVFTHDRHFTQAGFDALLR